MIAGAAQSPTTTEMIVAFRLDLVTKLALAVLMGGAIGLERQLAGKASGLRTNILICLGSAMIMDLSMNLGMSFGDVRVGDHGADVRGHHLGRGGDRHDRRRWILRRGARRHGDGDARTRWARSPGVQAA